MKLEELLGIDLSDPDQIRAHTLVEQDDQLLDKLIQMRVAQNLTQRDVGRMMGVTQSAVARIESAERDPHLSTLRRYAMAVRAVILHTVVPVDSYPIVKEPVALLLGGKALGEQAYRWKPSASESVEPALRALTER